MPELPPLPGREEYWNIGYPLLGTLVYVMILVTLGAIIYGYYKRYQIWRLGKPMPDLGDWDSRILRSVKLMGIDLFGHRRFIKRELYPGIMHLCFFWGAIILFIATSLGMAEANWHKFVAPAARIEFPTSYVRVYTSFIWDMGGVMMLVAVAMAVFRRYVLRPPRLNTMMEDNWFLGLVTALVMTGFVVEGLRIAATSPEVPWAEPVGYAVSLVFNAVGLGGSGGQVFTFGHGAAKAAPGATEWAHFALYWTHIGIWASILLYGALRFTKLSHIFVSPVNAFLRSDRPLGALRPMGNLEEMMEQGKALGAKDITDLTWKQLLDFDSCTNCGRCQDQCPAYASGKPLSPRKIVQDLRAYAAIRGPQILDARRIGEEPPAPAPLMVDFANREAAWSCLTCRACMEACPVFIEHIDSIVDMRRYMTMEEQDVPRTAMTALESMQQRGHPWRGTTFSRTDWANGLDVPLMSEVKDPGEVEVLFWVGCTAALEQRGQAVPRALAALMRAAGVKFAILGHEETCTGDPARRMGHEFLFQTLAEQNIGTFNRYGVKRIVTTCPHCFNSIGNEYPQFGGRYEVVHATQFIAELVQQGRLKPLKTINATISYHDSCYLGRHNRIFDEPRQIIKAIPGLQLIEMEQRRERGFCCGAGGGRIFMEEPGVKVNHLRTDHFLKTDAQVVGLSCPFCLQMFTEGIGAKGVAEQKQAKDILEILAESVGVGEASSPGT